MIDHRESRLDALYAIRDSPRFNVLVGVGLLCLGVALSKFYVTQSVNSGNNRSSVGLEMRASNYNTNSSPEIQR